jgi:ABC-type transport system involved in Fe-S cluster assembly fused permease/ATPase subunit
VPSKKQQRRREKQRRHEWEEVYVDAEGRELDPVEAEQLVAPDKRSRATAKTQRPARGGGRTVEPPSWRRTLKRGAIFFPLMLVVVFFVNSKNASTLESVISTVTLMAFFLPFSYFMDSVVWRAYERRQAKAASPEKRR